MREFLRKVAVVALAGFLSVSSLMMLGAPVMAAKCGGAETSLIECGETAENGIDSLLLLAVRVLVILIGVLGVIGVVISGIQYMTARDDPAQMTKAKNRIIHIAIGLVAYAVMWAFLQWLLPGGILNGQ